MFVTEIRHNQNGAALLTTLIFLMFMGMMAISLVTMVLADKRMQVLDIRGSQAFYAAQSGIEYALRGVMEHAQGSNDVSTLNGYSETLQTGGGTTCDISLNTIGIDSLEITATGRSATRARIIRKSVNYVDVSQYAIYTSGTVSNVSTSGGIFQNASHMPKFDLDVLRQLAIAGGQYYPGNLNINSPFSFTNDVIFAENDISFTNWNILNIGNFVAGRDITLNSPIITLFSGVTYQPTSGRTFQALGTLRIYLISGGVIANGNVTGTRYKLLWWWINNTSVVRNRNRTNAFMQYSVNGGPIVIRNSRWTIIH